MVEGIERGRGSSTSTVECHTPCSSYVVLLKTDSLDCLLSQHITGCEEYLSMMVSSDLETLYHAGYSFLVHHAQKAR